AVLVASPDTEQNVAAVSVGNVAGAGMHSRLLILAFDQIIRLGFQTFNFRRHHGRQIIRANADCNRIGRTELQGKTPGNYPGNRPEIAHYGAMDSVCACAACSVCSLEVGARWSQRAQGTPVMNALGANARSS